MAQFSEKYTIAGNFIRHYQYVKPLNAGFTRKTKEITKRTEGLKRPDSLRRTRTNFIDYIEANKSPYTKLLTLTTKEPIQNPETFRKHLRTFFKQFNKTFNTDIEYAYVLEGQKKRQETYNLLFAPLHAHILIFNKQKFPFQKLKELWPIGSVDIHRVKHIKSMGRYMAKYLTKESIQLNKKGFIRSANLTKAQTVRTMHPFPWDTPDLKNYYHFSTRPDSKQFMISDMNACDYREYHDQSKLEPLVNIDTGEMITPIQWFEIQSKEDFDPSKWLLKSNL